ncbi:hypothetical protein F511_25319 [Dorcoceras hygrometricum]|uniref:Uncharacterized protein n=1 Tax=Dorcoceras hygrometricum TaxID=472368 RepID=A0A2Z7D2L9_9LAMI|nr:hypothetical protein F511_25319 [Dorcoceras hygrometricum]
MQHAIIDAMKCMRAIKDQIARPLYQLAIISISLLHSVQLGYLKILQVGNTDPNNTKAEKQIQGQASKTKKNGDTVAAALRHCSRRTQALYPPHAGTVAAARRHCSCHTLLMRRAPPCGHRLARGSVATAVLYSRFCSGLSQAAHEVFGPIFDIGPILVGPKKIDFEIFVILGLKLF